MCVCVCVYVFMCVCVCVCVCLCVCAYNPLVEAWANPKKIHNQSEEGVTTCMPAVAPVSPNVRTTADLKKTKKSSKGAGKRDAYNTTRFPGGPPPEY
jgi:hypothetical protein